MGSFGWSEQDLAKVLAGRGKVVPVAAKPRHTLPQTKDGMNGLEARYAREVLDIRKYEKTLVDYKFEGIKLRLAKRTWYTPDFFVEMTCFPGHNFEVHEVKGHWEDDARVKIKVAAELYRCWKFFAIQRKKGIWIYEEIKP